MATPSRCLVPLALVLLPLSASAAVLHGHVIDELTREPVPGATVVARLDGEVDGEITAITDEAGDFTLESVAGTYAIFIFSGNRTTAAPPVSLTDDIAALDQIFSAAHPADEGITFTGSEDATDSYYVSTYDSDDGVGVAFEAEPVRQTALRWRRDAAGTDALDPWIHADRTAVSLDHAPRLAGAPAIALELIGEQTATIGGAPIEQAAGSGGVDELTLLHGTNDTAAGARLALGRQSRLSATLGKSMVDDHAWWSNGVVLDQTAAGLATQAMSTIEATGGEVTWRGAAVGSLGPAGDNDLWLATELVTKSDDDRRVIEVGLDGERLDRGPAPIARATSAVAAPRLVDRLGGRLIFRNQIDTHATTIGGEIGGGHADGVAHTDVRAFAGDRWQVKPHVTLEAAVRWDRRAIAGRSVELWAPRLYAAYDPTREGRVVLYAVAERAGHLDEVAFGAWRGDPHPYDDSVAAGYAGHRRHLRWSAAVRVRRPGAAAGDPIDHGVDATLRWSHAKHWDALLQASSLDRAATLSASWSCGCEKDELQLTAIARATPDDVGWGALAAIAHTPTGDGPIIVTSFGLEVLDLDDPAARSAHFVMNATW